MSVQALPRSRRRWLRTSVRGLIVLVMVIGAGLGWIVKSARIQYEAVAAIKNAGGEIAYDRQMSNGRIIPGARPWAPRRLVELIGIDYFRHVTDVWLISNSTPGHALMAHVGRLSRVRRLDVAAPSVTDAGMANLTGLTKLSTLDLSNADVTDLGLAHLAGLSELSDLDLSGTRAHRRWTGASGGVDQTLRPRSALYTGLRRRPGTSEATLQPFQTPPVLDSGHRSWAGSSEGAGRTLLPQPP